MPMVMKIPRAPWPADFPDVLVHTVLPLRDAHPDYHAGKSGNRAAATTLVEDLISEEKVETARRCLAGRRPIIAPVRAIETTGINQIPDGFAYALGQRLGLLVTADLFQTNKVGHTLAKGFPRLAFQPTFAGSVVGNAEYLLVDDHVGLGGTLANLRGYIESQGGRVVLAITLTASRKGSEVLALRPQSLQALWKKHGEPLDQEWRHLFGFGIDALTDAEAGYLGRTPSVDGIRNGIAEAIRQGVPAGVQ